jgi:hypothetical protein
MKGRQGYDRCWPAVVAPLIVNLVVTVSLESISEHQEIRGISLVYSFITCQLPYRNVRHGRLKGTSDHESRERLGRVT